MKRERNDGMNGVLPIHEAPSNKSLLTARNVALASVGSVVIGLGLGVVTSPGIDAGHRVARAVEDTVSGELEAPVNGVPIPRIQLPPNRTGDCVLRVYLSDAEQVELLGAGSTTELTDAAQSFEPNDALAKINVIMSTEIRNPNEALANAIAASAVEHAYPAVISSGNLVALGVSDVIHGADIQVGLLSSSCVVAGTARMYWDQPRPA